MEKQNVACSSSGFHGCGGQCRGDCDVVENGDNGRSSVSGRPVLATAAAQPRELRSGLKYARTALFTGGRQIPSIVLRVEPIGSRRLPNLHLLDFRAEKTVALFTTHKVAVRLDVFNALNINTVTGVTQQSGTTFNRPSAIIPGSNVQFGLTYSF